MPRRLRLLLPLLLVAVLVPAGVAWADGDPGSDVLVYQPLFLAADANVGVSQQVQLGKLLTAAQQRRFPIRVAIIASPSDLGAVTELWRMPRSYARYLGLELALGYSGRLLVVMPNGFGFNWPGHSPTQAYRTLARIGIGSGGSGLVSAAASAVQALAAAAGRHLTIPPRSGGASARGPGAATSGSLPTPSASAATRASRASPGSSFGAALAAIVAALILAASLGLLAIRQGWLAPAARRLHRIRRGTILGATAVGAAGAAIVALVLLAPAGTTSSDALAVNPNLDPGTPLARPAPDFTLSDQFAQPVSLRSFRGGVVVLAFNDSECTTICPLTTTAMLDAQAMLGSAGRRVALLGVDANPKATSLEDVFSYSELHGMLHAWHFLTGSLPALERVWRAYGVQAEVQAGEIAHTPALFVIDPRGRLRRVYITQQSYAAVGQLGQLLAREASRLLPGHPPVHSSLGYQLVGGIPPTSSIRLPRAGGGKLSFGPGRPRLLAFFATWDRQITGLASGLQTLARYDEQAHGVGLPSAAGVDEGSVEPPGALGGFLAGLPRLPYPVAVDTSGRVADGYEVEGLPWLVLVTSSGRIAWYDSVAASGWPTATSLVAHVRAALAHAPGAPGSLHAALAELAGSPPGLAELHAQADRLLGDETALAARIRALRGYPIVLNAWGSWCGPCQAESALFASASARFGRQVAFLGADINDDASDAQSFLATHPVSYPSYQLKSDQMTAILPPGLLGTPTTVFISPRGKIAAVHTGQYDSQGTLDADITTYALHG